MHVQKYYHCREALWMDTYPPRPLAAVPMSNGTLLLQEMTDPNGAALFYGDEHGRLRHASGNYMQLSQQNLTTFYHPTLMREASGKESPCPYATTTLVMQSHQQNLLNERFLAQLQQQQTLHHLVPAEHRESPRLLTCNSNQRIGHQSGRKSAGTGSEPSPPHTESSYLAHTSSDRSQGTGSSNEGCNRTQQRSKAKLTNSKPQLLDFLPPPPAQPPPDGSPDFRNCHPNEQNYYHAADPALVANSVPLERRERRLNSDADYAALNELLRSFHSSSPLMERGIQSSLPSVANGTITNCSQCPGSPSECASSRFVRGAGSPRSSYLDPPDSESKRSSMIASLAESEDEDIVSRSSSIGDESAGEGDAFLPGSNAHVDFATALARAAVAAQSAHGICNCVFIFAL